MDKIEELKQDLLDRYNGTWEEGSYDKVLDTLGIVEECKENFKNTLETLIKLIYAEKSQKKEENVLYKGNSDKRWRN